MDDRPDLKRNDPESEASFEHLQDGTNVAEVRFLLRRLFARFVVHDTGDGAIVPELRDDAVEELLANLNATKRRALRLITDANGLLMASMFRPSPVGPGRRGLGTSVS